MKIRKMGLFLKVVTFGRIAGITLAPFGIYIKEKYLDRDNIIRHETIHWKQQFELWIIFFYLWYIIEWFIRLFINGKAAYRKLSFEQEAALNEYDEGYLEIREPYEWLKYLKKSV